MSNKNKGLGRGLSALMSDIQPTTNESVRNDKIDRLVAIEKIHANPNQPRRKFDETDLNDLSQSVSEKGVIQPIIVRAHPSQSGDFEIVAGERRWRAAQRAKLHEMPVIVRDYTDTEVLEVAIIENIQRADLNPVDEAAGYQALMSQFGHTQEQLAQVLGKSRSHIANQMRLLTLPDGVLNLLSDGKLTSGHARALIGNDRAEEIARKIVASGLSVREVERLVKAPVKPAPSDKAKTSEKDADTIQIERELAAHLGLKVNIQHKTGTDGGVLSLGYKSLEQLDDLLRLLSGQ